ncbi:unnamed protein product [Linum trigynum]|uniref:Uncharacterized protein n=1 Tax=Linum trigynum TaxID=586398 RepID=A0AAV2E0P8_9ROSI
MHQNPSPTVATSLASDLVLIDIQLALGSSISALCLSIFASVTIASYLLRLTHNAHLAETPSYAKAKPVNKKKIKPDWSNQCSHWNSPPSPLLDPPVTS